jgi:hypothetical protein
VKKYIRESNHIRCEKRGGTEVRVARQRGDEGVGGRKECELEREEQESV